jgi:hypothetical protein
MPSKDGLAVMKDHGRRIQLEKDWYGSDGGIVPALLPVPAHGEHVVGEELAEAQIGLIGFGFQLIGRPCAA